MGTHGEAHLLVAGDGTPMRPTSLTLVWARFELTEGIVPPAITQFKRTPNSNRVDTKAGRGESASMTTGTITRPRERNALRRGQG